MSEEKEFSVASMKKAFKEETSKRISRGSAEELNDELEERGREITEIAVEFAEEDGRKTVRREDIRKAVKLYKS